MKDYKLKILKNEEVASGIYLLVLDAKEVIENIKPGQFLNIKLKNEKRLLRRPLCVSDYYDNKLEVYYQVVGEGTKELSGYEKETIINVLLPLGNGFPEVDDNKRILLIGGGVGAAMFPLIERCNKKSKVDVIIGYATKEKIYLNKENYQIATDDGTFGYKGYATELADKKMENEHYDYIFCCGPEIMYKSLYKCKNLPYSHTYISLEKRMGCGFGACLVCNCEIKTKSGIKNLRACKDGPIFKLEEVVL